MAATDHDHVGKALNLLKEGLRPFVEQQLKGHYQHTWRGEINNSLLPQQRTSLDITRSDPQWDVATLLAVMWNQWNQVFRNTLRQAERNLVSELRDVRNRWAHQQTFSRDDADRALDSAERLLTAVSASQADEVRKMKMDLRRGLLADQRTERHAPLTGGVEARCEVANPLQNVSYHVYVNLRHAAHKARVHFSHCSHCNHGEGTQARSPNDESYWLPRSSLGFDSFAEAMSQARSTGMHISICKHCNPS